MSTMNYNHAPLGICQFKIFPGPPRGGEREGRDGMERQERRGWKGRERRSEGGTGSDDKGGQNFSMHTVGSVVPPIGKGGKNRGSSASLLLGDERHWILLICIMD